MSSPNTSLRQLLSIPEAKDAAGISRTSLYGLISSGQLPSVKVGRRRLIRASDLAAWAASLPSASTGHGKAA